MSVSLSPFPGQTVSDSIVRVQQALAAMREGTPVILMDDFDREDEADLIIAAEKITDRTMALLIRECSGIVCLCLPDETLQRLDLPAMVDSNESRYGTAFTVSIEARQGVTTGVSAADRVTTIRAAIADDAQPEHLARPGHVFPLRARPNGVLERRGHTEGSVDLARLAGLKPAGVLCELMNEDGTMMRGEQITRFAALHGMPMLTIEDIVAYRRAEALARNAICAPTGSCRYGKDSVLEGARPGSENGDHHRMDCGDGAGLLLGGQQSLAAIG